MASKRSAKTATTGKKTAVAKKSPARKKTGAAAASDKRKRPPRDYGGPPAPPATSFWLTGTLGVEGGVIGMKRSDGTFISMAAAAAGGHLVTLVFQPTGGGKPGEVQTMLSKLGEFFEQFGVANIPCGYTCCGGP